jgi:hypothetical protein
MNDTGMSGPELGPTGKKTQRYALIRIPVDSNSEVVGTFLRPERPVTIGKRDSDRWLALSVAIMLGVFAVGEVITAILLWNMYEVIDRCLP